MLSGLKSGMLFILAGWIHILLAPYTKVEESFNLHATHDLIYYGALPSSLQSYDHFVFPGVVPRTFIGSIALSSVVYPLKYVAQALGLVHSKYDVQVLVRLTLATINALGLLYLRRTVMRRFGSATSTLFTLLTCTQFHVPFWMGRTLPNMFALFPVIVACAHVVEREYSVAIALLTFAAVTLRAELVLLLGAVVLQALYLQPARAQAVFKTGIAATVLSLALTVCVDSYFWARWPLWPELTGVYFNVYEGKSAEWGVSPAHAYFTAHLPKLLLAALPLSLLGLFVDARARTLVLPCAAFVALLSCLGHKEWRFIVYVVPLWNVVGACGAEWLLSAHRRGATGRLCRLVVLGLLVGNALATALLTRASVANYPGGVALAQLNDVLVRERGVAVVHIGNYAAQTGASLFLHELTPHVVYDKTEELSVPGGYARFDWAIEEAAEAAALVGAGWEVEGAGVEGLKGVERQGMHARVMKEVKLWVLHRRGSG